MKRKRHTAEQIIQKLRESEADLAAGLSMGEICQKLGVSEATFSPYGERNQYGGMKAEAMKRLEALFELEPVWMYGLADNRALLLLMVYCYQLLLYYNWRRRRRVNHLKHLLDAW